MRKQRLNRLALSVAGLALIVTGVGFARTQGVLDQLELIIDVRHAIVSGFVEEPDQQAMIDAAVRGMIDAVDDPYTVFLEREELESFQNHVRGSFSGIGAEIDIHEERLRIVSPLEDSPAWRAGVLPGDVVLEIEGEDTTGIKITEAVQRLTGEAGTDVTITVRHESGETRTLTITREVINVKTVRGFRRDADNVFDHWLDPEAKIAYIRLTQFGTRTVDEFRETLVSLDDQGMRGLVLDLRFNPGGLLEAAVGVSDMFLPGGRRIVSIEGRAVSEQVHSSTDDATVTGVPLVVLANESSASASEITAGALRDNDRALVVGTRTFGKGSVQQVRLLDSGGALKMTNAYYYLPSGRKVHRTEGAEAWGVDPSPGQYVAMDTDTTRAMFDARRNASLLRLDDGETPAAVTPRQIEDELNDPQLAAGYRAIRGRLDAGGWPAVGIDGGDAVLAAVRLERLEQRKQRLLDAVAELEDEIAGLGVAVVEEDADEPVEAPAP